MKRKIILISPLVILLIVIVLGLIALGKSDKKNTIETKLLSGKVVMMPEFSLPDLYDSSKTFSNSDIKGKYVLINVFASWCVSCAAEHQTLVRLSKSGKIKVYGIAWRDIGENTKKYLSNYGNPYEKIGVDSKGTFSKLLFVSGTPESFLIDPDGRIVKYWKGQIDNY